MPLENPDNLDLDTAFTQAQPDTSTTASPPSPAADVSAPASAAPTQPALSQDWISQAQAAGLPLDGINSESDLLGAVLKAYASDRPFAQHGRTALAVGQSQVNQAEQGTKDEGSDEEVAFDAEKHFSGLWNAPQLDNAAQFAIQNGIVRLGDSGLYEAAPGFEAMALPILNNLNQSHISQKQQLQKFFEGNPFRSIYDAILPALKHELSTEFKQYSQQSLQGYEREAFADQWRRENADWLFKNGQLTDHGRKYQEAENYFLAKGVTDLKDLAELAMLKAGINPQAIRDAAKPPAAPVAQPADPAVPQNQDRPRGPDGKFLPAPPAKEPTKQESFIEKAKRMAGASNSSSGYTEGVPGHAVAASQGDLDSMFTSAFTQAAA